jgi:hypothetical protein
MTRLTPLYKAALSAVTLLAGTVLATAPASAQITPPEGNVAFLSLFADGVQIYDSAPDLNNPGAFVWKFTAPSADLFTDASETTHVATHFAGPTWQADADGSAVVGMLSKSQPSPNPDSIPELLLSAKPHSGVGIFDDVTFIQRLDTVGGLAPAAAPTGDGQEFQSPYTATYRFYQAVPEPGMTALFAGAALSGAALSGAALLMRRRRIARR